ncbi:MAG: polysaccharide export protein [Lysobacterales bacterium]|nr:MAG: polysaccharide export protein [Xanthomonadales bacterium]
MKPGHVFIFNLVVGAWLLLLGGSGFAAGFQDRNLSNPLRLSQTVQIKTPTSDVGTSRSGATDYRIDTGDRISITVYQEPDLSVIGVRVNANGTIAYPLLGDLRVDGLTSQELQDLVTSKLLDGYLKNPSINVSIDSYRLYYIKGEVNRPGGYAFVDGLTVAKAVALAGGYTARASEGKITLVREADPENPLETAGTNTPIRPGDVITVGESFF